MGEAQLFAGRKADATATFQRIIRAIKPTPDAVVVVDQVWQPNILALAYAALGDKPAALDAARRAVEAYRSDGVSGPAAEVTQAQVQALVGEREAAIAALPHLLQVPAGLTIGLLKFDPMWDSIRDDPRVQKLLAGPPPPTIYK
jgi:tetratricopeptide (TPR) repeat protein